MPGARARSPRVLITGASGGIGRALARELLARGWGVFGGVRRKEDARSLRVELGTGFTPLMLEVTDPRSVAEAAGAVEAALGGGNLEALVNSAGIIRLGPLACLPTEALREQFEVNLFGLFEVIRRFLPLLGATRRSRRAARSPSIAARGPPASAPGRIVNLSSSSGRQAMPFFGLYAASKHALEGLSDSLRRELRLYGIRVILIEPSIVRTPMVEKALFQAEAFRGTDWWPAIQAAVKAARLDRPGGTLPVERVVRVLLRALTSPHPRARYAVVRRPLLGWWLPRALPDRVLDLMVERALGLIPRKGD
jgi:NAD(P)-dependent dehydrogenase (short-subunit alcohol dehydrogenase family)